MRDPENTPFNVNELAESLGRCRDYVTRMKRWGFIMVAGKATRKQALDWLRAHPEFKTHKKPPPKASDFVM